MNSTSPFMTVEKTGEDTISWTIHLLENTGLRVMRTFDLCGASVMQPSCPCPQHGTEACDCQISILLIYQKEQPPASLLIHSYQETTWLHLVNTPEQPIDKALEILICDTLVQRVPSTFQNGGDTFIQGNPL
jgi:hypothetical protein